MNTPHGLAIDTRSGMPRLLVADREKRRLVRFDFDANWIDVHASHLRRPCAISILGDNPDSEQWVTFGVPPADQRIGISFDPDGNL